MVDYTNTKIAANYFRGPEAVGGHLSFDEFGLTFESHAFNKRTGITRIEYTNIMKISKCNTLGIVPNGVAIFDKNAVEHRFVVHKRSQVIEFLRWKQSVIAAHETEKARR